jgi:glycerol-3-phosphate acyltransferase PlsY
MIENFTALCREISGAGANGLALAACVAASYLAGNISPSIIIGRIYGIDIRSEGSGNAGTTNALRVLGRKAAAATLVVDVLKGFLPVFLAARFAGAAFALLCGFAALCGHVWPLLHGFKGGKGVATGIGAILAFDFRIGLALLCIAGVMMAATRRVSVGALAAAAAFPFFTQAWRPVYLAPAIVIAAVIWVKHRKNVARIVRGEEPKLRFKA